MPEILYHDEHIAVALKPAGLLSEGDGEDCLPTLLLRELNGKRAESGLEPLHTLYTVHRLDRDTEGITVYALSSKAAAELSRQIQSDLWHKEYVALLWGSPEQDSGRLEDLLFYDRKRSKSFVVKRQRQGVKRAVLDYEVLSRLNDRTAVRVILGTGRTHQIRVQFASRGLPLCGDRRYGAPAESGKNLCLCAAALSFKHPITGKPLSFSTSPLGFRCE